MFKEFRILIVEPDPYARQWLALLTVRDWRTTLVGEIPSADALLQFFKKNHPRVDMILLDIESPMILPRATSLLEALAAVPACPPVLCLGLQGDQRILSLLNKKPFVGYLLKEEVRHGVIWAASFASEGYWVCTPGISALGLEHGFPFSEKTVVVNGQHWLHQFNEREVEVARMAFLFSVERHDLADELDISEDYAYSVVSAIYKKLGLDALFHGEENPNSILGDNPLILQHFNRILEGMRKSTKAKDMETLAFHILTMPEIRGV